MCDVEGIHSKRLINAKSMGYHVCGTTQIQLESAAQKKNMNIVPCHSVKA
jgi:hypothetical protein